MHQIKSAFVPLFIVVALLATAFTSSRVAWSQAGSPDPVPNVEAEAEPELSLSFVNTMYQPGERVSAMVTLLDTGTAERAVTVASDPAGEGTISAEDSSFSLAPDTSREIYITMPDVEGTYTFVASSPGVQSSRATVEVAVRTWAVGTPITRGTIGAIPITPTAVGTTPTPTPRPEPAPGGTTPTPTPTPTPTTMTVTPGQQVSLSVQGYSDQDHYQQGESEGNEADTLVYAWNGAGITGGATTSSITVTAPISGTATLNCTINDTPTPLQGAGGTRDDTGSVTASITLVVNSGTGGGTTGGGTTGGDPPAQAPCNITLTAHNGTWPNVQLSWSRCNHNDFSSYQLYRSTEANFTPSDATYIGRSAEVETAVNTISYEDSGATRGQTNYYVLVTSHGGSTTRAAASIAVGDFRVRITRSQATPNPAEVGEQVVIDLVATLDAPEGVAADSGTLWDWNFGSVRYRPTINDDWGPGPAMSIEYIGGVPTAICNVVFDAEGEYEIQVTATASFTVNGSTQRITRRGEAYIQ